MNSGDLRVVMARDHAVDNWLMQEVGPAYDALKVNPARGVTVDGLRAALAVEHKMLSHTTL